MQASKDRKLDDIRGQIKDQLDCVINEMKIEMENKIIPLEEKVIHIVEEITGNSLF